MTGFVSDGPIFAPPPEEADADYAATPPSWLQTLGAEARGNPTAWLAGAAERGTQAGSPIDDQALAQYQLPGDAEAQAYGFAAPTPAPVETPVISAAEANQRFAPIGPDGQPVPIATAPMPEGLARIIGQQKTDKMQRDGVIARYQDAHGFLTNMATGAVGSMLDPANFAANFVMPNLGVMLALSAAGGYLRMVVNDLATGKDPRNPLDPRWLLEALAQGGGLGLYGDFLFGEHMRMDPGLAATAGGPVSSDAENLLNLFFRWRDDTLVNPHRRWPHGRFSDLAGPAAHIMVRHVPFANYVYLKGALDYLLWYHLYEAAAPGWWERANRRMAREQGRVMAGYTPGAGVPWAPWGVGAPTMTVPARR